jgi:hypothetical protein
LIKRIEAVTESAAAQCLSIHFCGLPERGALIETGAHRTEIGMIEQIEKIRPELKLDTIRQSNFAPEGEIYLP